MILDMLLDGLVKLGNDPSIDAVDLRKFMYVLNKACTVRSKRDAKILEVVNPIIQDCDRFIKMIKNDDFEKIIEETDSEFDPSSFICCICQNSDTCILRGKFSDDNLKFGRSSRSVYRDQCEGYRTDLGKMEVEVEKEYKEVIKNRN
jgi:hypothetical protein